LPSATARFREFPVVDHDLKVRPKLKLSFLGVLSGAVLFCATDLALAQSSKAPAPHPSYQHGMSDMRDGGHGHGAQHGSMQGSSEAMRGSAAPVEPGQSAFAAIAEIVELLRGDPETDWSRVDIAALRRHLVDMNNVTMRASVRVAKIQGGARFEVSSGDADVKGSIRRMVLAHAATMSGYEGMTMRGEQIDSGAALSVTGPNATMIRSLGFFGIATIGMHHQAHHLAIARGTNPHAH
jgi:hypothetical protein